MKQAELKFYKKTHLFYNIMKQAAENEINENLIFKIIKVNQFSHRKYMKETENYIIYS